MMEKEYTAIRDQVQRGKKKRAEASTVAMFYQALEDHILQAMLVHILERPAQHVSLHHDGVRVDNERISSEGGDATHMCKALEAAVLRDTGFKVKVVIKKHILRFDVSMAKSSSVDISDSIH